MLLRRISLVATLLLAIPASALAQKPANADRVRSAADEYDAGRRAFNDSKFDEAAVHFENAFRDAPAAAAIRNAITARAKAGHAARAATEAALAQTKYPDDAATRDLVKATLAELEPKLHKTVLNCNPECGVVADNRAVSIEDAARVVFYLDPGDHEVVVSWGEDRTKVVKVSAKAGGKSDFTLEAPPPKPKPPVDTGGATGAAGSNPPPASEQPSKKPFGPVVFIIGSVLTVGGGVALAVSGVDTLNNPGTEKVKTACAGKGEQCPEYQQGLSAQTRTNVILGATIGVGVLTAVVGIFFTQWSSSPKTKEEARNVPKIRPLLELGSTSQVGLQGSF